MDYARAIRRLLLKEEGSVIMTSFEDRRGAGNRTPQGEGTGPGQRPASGRGYTGQEPAMKLSFTLNGDPVSRHVDGGETLVDFPA